MSDFADIRPDLSGVGAVIATATAAKSGTTVTATINGVVVTVQVSRDLSISLGDVIVILKVGSQWVAIGRMFTAAPLPPENDIPPSPVAPVTGQLTVAPVETRTYQAGKWRSDTSVFQGQYGGTGNRTGAVFYGAGPRSIVGATVTAAWIHVRRDSGGIYAAQATTMWLMTQATRPGGAPTLGASVAGPFLATNTTNNTFSIPTAWAQSMVNGTAGGLAFFTASSSPYVQFAGLGDWGPAFTMIMNWSR